MAEWWQEKVWRSRKRASDAHRKRIARIMNSIQNIYGLRRYTVQYFGNGNRYALVGQDLDNWQIKAMESHGFRFVSVKRDKIKKSVIYFIFEKKEPRKVARDETEIADRVYDRIRNNGYDRPFDNSWNTSYKGFQISDGGKLYQVKITRVKRP